MSEIGNDPPRGPGRKKTQRMSPAETAAVYNRLEANFIKDEGYAEGWDDARVAIEASVSVDHVQRMRQRYFGKVRMAQPTFEEQFAALVGRVDRLERLVLKSTEIEIASAGGALDAVELGGDLDNF